MTVIDSYLREATGELDDRKTGITEVVDLCIELFGMSRSTIMRWRKEDKISNVESALSIILAINSCGNRKCNLKDIAILCNYKELYRKDTETVDI